MGTVYLMLANRCSAVYGSSSSCLKFHTIKVLKLRLQ